MKDLVINTLIGATFFVGVAAMTVLANYWPEAVLGVFILSVSPLIGVVIRDLF